jgi:hypothetical protein
MKALLLGLALVLGAPVGVLAHGDDHAAGQPAASGPAVTLAGYRVVLSSHPADLALGTEHHVTATVTSAATGEPVAGGRVSLGLAPSGEAPAPAPAAEAAWAGSYTRALTPTRRGPAIVRVELEELEGRHFHPPLATEFAVAVGAAPGPGAAVWTLLSLLIGGAAAVLYGIALRARFVRQGEAAVDWLQVAWIRRALTWPVWQRVLQGTLLLLTAIVVAVGLGDVQDGGKNLATKLTWTIWWAGIIFTFVLAGRVWCVACPFGALNEWTARLAAPLRRLPRPFRNVWWATAMFVLLTWADEQLGVVRSPRVTAWIVLGVAALAVAVGLRYERRSFCRHLCPIGGLIGIYSMLAPVELRPRERAVCAGDHEKPCYRGSERAVGCPMFEFPGSLDRNNYCTLCAQCVTGCDRHNLTLRLRTFGKDLWAAGRRALDEAYLAIALVGLTLVVTAQMLTAWPDWISALARWLPSGVRAGLKPVTYLGALESAVLLGAGLVVGPLLLLGAAAWADRQAGPRGLGVRRAFVHFGYMFVPVGLAMHLAHNLAHLLLEGGGIVPVVQRAVALYTPWSLGTPDWTAVPLAAEPVVTVVQMAILVGFFGVSLLAGHRLALRLYGEPRTAARALVPLAALSLVFTVAGILLLNQPMGMRHGS